MSRIPSEENRQASHVRRALLHELTEALTAIQGYATAARHLARQGPPEATAELTGSVDRLSEQVQRAIEILRRFRSAVGPIDAGEREG